MKSYGDLAYYPSDYGTARGRFIETANELRRKIPRTQIRSFTVPSRRDNGLDVGYVYIPPASVTKRLITMVSGVHGAEAFTGSAVQQMFFNEFQARLDSRDTGYLIVHALNPFGFKYGRRVTENNVNLNRNFSTSNDLFRIQNPGYGRLAPVLEPTGPVRHPSAAFLSMATKTFSLILSGEFNMKQFSEAIGQGQFEHPRGLEYGGGRIEPQITDFITTFGETLRGYEDIVLLDIHTGLGDRYQLHLMPPSRDGGLDKTLFDCLFKPSRDSDIYVHTTGDTKGFYHTHGDLTNVLPDLLAPSQRAVGLTIEFGTLGNDPVAKLKTLNRLILENQGFHHGYADAAYERRVKAAFDELFFPSEAKWRGNVIARSRELLQRIFVRLEAGPDTPES